jgi:tRNA modification GTPase
VLAVFDMSSPLDENDNEIIPLINPKNTVVILNKSDKGSLISKDAFSAFKTVTVSAKEGLGKEEVEKAVAEIVGLSKIDSDSAILLSERQRDLAEKAHSAVLEAKELILSGYTIDAVGVCIDEALSRLYELDGKRVTNEVADEVFRRFCVGK